MEGQETNAKQVVKIDLEDLNRYLNIRLCPPYLPVNGEEDWNIFGSCISKVYGPDGVFPKEYQDGQLIRWIQDRILVRELLRFTQRKIFCLTEMLNNKRATDRVRIRIVVSMLNKLGLPKRFEDEIFDNIHLQYQVRKPVFEDYYVIKIFQLPFELPDTRVCPF